MKKIVGCFLCFAMLFGSVSTFGEASTATELYENVKVMELQLTQGDQEALVESIQMIMAQNTTTPAELIQLIDVSAERLDAEKTIMIVDDYCDFVIEKIDSKKITSKDAQSTTDKLIGLLGKKVMKMEGINQDHVKALLKKVTDKNALLQGEVAVQYQQTLKVANLDKMLLDVERAYRIVNSGFNTYNGFKELGRDLQKQLVLLASTENVDLTLEAEMVKRLIKDNIGVSVNHNGVMYQIPTSFLEKHIGDLKISIQSVATNISDDVIYSVNGGIIKPVIVKNLAIGYATNPEMVKVSMPLSLLEVGMPANASYGFFAGMNEQCQKLMSDMDYGTLITSVNGTGNIGVGRYQATYTDLSGHWAQNNITDLLARGIAVDNGTMIYGPNDVMKRGEFVRMLINIIGTEGKSANIFTDVPAGSAYSDIIESVIYYGLTIGVTENEFKSETPLTREDMVALASKMFEIKKGISLMVDS